MKTITYPAAIAAMRRYAQAQADSFAALALELMEMLEKDDPKMRHEAPTTQPHLSLWEAATQEPTPGKVLSKRAGYASMHSRIRQALTDLVRTGHLVRTADGYRRG